MEERKQKEYLKSIADGSFDMKQKFFDFKLQTTISLTLSQLQFFQFISGLVLAIASISFGLDYIKPDIFLLYPCLFATFLLIITTSFTREIIDIQLNGLEVAEEVVNNAHDKIMEKLTESINEKSIDPMIKFSEEQISKEKQKKHEVLLSGEIIVFLFFNTVFSFFTLITHRHSLLILLVVMTLSYFLSFKNWSLGLLKYLSREI